MAQQIPEMMLAAQVVEKHYKILEVPTPGGKDLDEHDMLVKVVVGSLCHTGGMVTEGIMGSPLPCMASHEGARTVVKVGSAITEFEVGDRVLCSLTYHPCCVCPECIDPEKDTQYCEKAQCLGVTRDGSFAEYEAVDGRECCMLPGGIIRTGLKTGESLAIIGGGGGLGHLGVQFGKALGLRVVAIGARDEALELAKECGADTIVDARLGKEIIVQQVRKVTGFIGADVTINVSNLPLPRSVAVTKMHGIMVQIAQPSEVSVPFAELVFRDVRIHGSLVSSRGECQKMLSLVAKHNIKVKTNPFQGLKELPKAVELAHSGKMQGEPVILIDEEAIRKERASGLQMV